MEMTRRNALAATAGSLLGAGVLATAAAAEPAGGSLPGQPPGPDVRVVNTTAEPVPVSIQGAAHIDTSSPIPVRDVDRRPQQPVQFALFLPGPSSYTVPAGKQLVIEFVSGGFGLTSNGGALASILLELSPGTFAPAFPGTPTSYNDGAPSGLGFAFSQSCRIYASPGTTLSIHGSQGITLASMNVSGYLVDAD